MKLRTVDEEGNVLHDCEKIGCSVSLDGLPRGKAPPAAPLGAFLKRLLRKR